MTDFIAVLIFGFFLVLIAVVLIIGAPIVAVVWLINLATSFPPLLASLILAAFFPVASWALPHYCNWARKHRKGKYWEWGGSAWWDHGKLEVYQNVLFVLTVLSYALVMLFLLWAWIMTMY